MVLTATSTYSTATQNSASRTFTLTLKNQCWDVTLTAPSFVSTTESFELFETQTIVFNPAVDTTLGGNCGAFTYKVYYVSSQAEVDTSVYSVDTTNAAAPFISATPSDRATWVTSLQVYVEATYASFESVTSSN